MAIVPIELGSAPTGAGGDTNREAFTKLNASVAELDTRAVPTEAVAGGAGFVDATGTVALSLASARAFHRTMTGNLTLSFTDVPNADTTSAAWALVLRVDATGGYLFVGPTVTWLDGSTWDDLDLSANAENIVAFKRVGVVTYASLITNGALSLDPYVLSFPTNGTQLAVVTRAETLGLDAVTNVEADGTAGTGTLSFKKNGGADISPLAATAFAAGDVLTVTLASATTASVVSIPRFA